MKNIKKLFSTVLMGTAISLISATASADIVDIDINGVASWDAFDDDDNTRMIIDIGGGNEVTIDGIGWDVMLTTEGASWLSEAVISFGNTLDQDIITLTVGVGDEFTGFMNYSSNGIVDLSDAGIDDLVLNDGLLYLQFYETFDDVPDVIDALYNGFISASFTRAEVQVPAPSMIAILAMGIAGIGFTSRLKKA